MNNENITIVETNEFLRFINSFDYSKNKKIKAEVKKYLQQIKKNNGEFCYINSNDLIINELLNSYKEMLDIKMIEKSLLASMFEKDRNIKFRLEYLYKKLIAQKLNNLEQTAIEEIKNDAELFKYVIYTQNYEKYLNKDNCKIKLKKYL